MKKWTSVLVTAIMVLNIFAVSIPNKTDASKNWVEGTGTKYWQLSL